MADLTQGQVSETMDMLKSMLGNNDESNELAEMLVQALAAPEDTFAVVAPGIMQSFQQVINNPNDKIALAQALNATGYKVEDLSNDVAFFMEEVDKSDLSEQKRDFIKQFFATYINAINDTEGIAKRNVPVAIELCHEDAKIPQYAHITDSGADVYALEDIVVKPGETVLVSTGLKVALLPGFELQVRPKSGRALKTKLRVANTPGTIDQGYRDEIKVIIENVEPRIKDITIDEDGKVTSVLYGRDFVIGKGEKFCQLVLNEVPKASFYRVSNVMEIDEENRGGGFGSSGLI